MAIRFQCPHCQGVLSISSRRIGAVVPCPTCQHEVLVPDRDMFEPAPPIPQLVAAPAEEPALFDDEPLRLAGDARGAQFETRDEQPPPDGPSLLLRFADGRQQAIALDKSTPVTIGRQSFNDVSVPDDDVASLHCRVGWNRSGFEITAATPQGVEVNGVIVEHAILDPGDLVRVGSVDIVYHEPGRPAGERRARERSQSPEPPRRDAAEPSLFEGPVLAESASNLPIAEIDDSDAAIPLPDRERQTADAPDGVVGRIWSELDGARRRPGEQDIFRSPTILALTIGVAVLLLTAAAFWFMIGREQRLRLYELADTEFTDGRHAEAITHFEEFLNKYPTHRLARSATLGLGKARVLKEMSGGAPSWELAWQRLDELVETNRNTADYRDLQPLVRDYAEQIAIGSARAAEANRTESLLEITDKATGLMERSAPPDTPQTGPKQIIRTATERARIAIARQGELDATVLRMQDALTRDQPIAALSERAALLRKFPEFGKEGRIRDTLQRALKMEQQRISAENIDRAALTDDPAPPVGVTPVFHSRSRSDETSLGQSVLVIGQDALYAVDTMTGEPAWRRIVGSNPPFFPMVVRSTVNGLLCWDGRRRELVLCRMETGQAVWRQPLEQLPVPSPPCIEDGQIYLATEGGRLERFDLETGRHTARMQFSQDLAGAPVLAPDKEHLLVAGDRGILYSLKRHPLECAALTFTDHGPKSIRAPLRLLGRMLLVCENDQGASARLRLWDATRPEATLTEVGEVSQRVPGAVYEPPVLRGSHLVVASSGERLAAFAVNDEPGRMGLAPIGQYRLQDGYGGPQYVMLGPDQQFWVSSSAFRKFEIAAESLRMDPNAVAIGVTSQPLQAVGETFYVGRRPFFGSAVVLTNIDRERMTGTWRLAVGGRPQEVLPSASGGATIVTDSGHVFRMNSNRLAQGGIDLRGGTEVEVPPEVRESLLVNQLSDGRIVLAHAGERPKCWFIDAEGRVATGPAFEQPPECAPVLLDDGLVWPSSGRLQLKALSGNRRFDDWRAESSDDPPAWMWLLQTGPHELLAAQQDGVLRRVQARTGDVPHLAEAASAALMLAPARPVLIHEEVACIAADRTLQWINARSLDVVPVKLPGDVRSLHAAGDKVLVQLEDDTAILTPPGAEPTWSTVLTGFRVTGPANVAESSLWLADGNGQVAKLDLQTGKVQERRSAPQPLTMLRELSGTLWAVSTDSTLYRVETLPQVQP